MQLHKIPSPSYKRSWNACEVIFSLPIISILISHTPCDASYSRLLYAQLYSIIGPYSQKTNNYSLGISLTTKT